MTAVLLVVALLVLTAAALALVRAAPTTSASRLSSPLGDGPPVGVERLWWPGVEPPVPRERLAPRVRDVAELPT